MKDFGQIMVMYGSTIVADLITERAVPHPALWSLTGTYEDTFCLAGGLSASGALTTWLRDLLGGVEYAVLTEEAEDVPPGSNGLLALPYFAGERTPISDPHARGVIVGLDAGHHTRRAVPGAARGHRVRHPTPAAVDGRGRRGRQALRRGRRRHEGGVWTQIISDVCSIEQDLPKYAIGACYGDALLAAQAAGLADESTNWAQIAHTVRPNPDTKQVYDDLFAHYLDLLATKDIEQHCPGCTPGSRAAATRQSWYSPLAVIPRRYPRQRPGGYREQREGSVRSRRTTGK